MYTQFINTVRRYSRFLSLFCLVFVIYGCSHDHWLVSDSGDPSLVEGEKTTLLIGLNNLDMKVNTRASLDPDKEREIVSLAVFIFDSYTGVPVSSTFHEVAGIHAVDVNGNPDPTQKINPDGTNYIPIETFTGNNRHIYVIANYNSNVVEELKTVSSEEDLKNVVFEQMANPLLREFGLMKVGADTVNVRKDTPIEIKLNYVSAKVTLKVTNLNTANFKVEGWTVGNIPRRGYVIERNPLGTNPNYHDAVDVSKDDDYYNDFADQMFAFETSASISSPGVGTELSSTFYLIENRAGGRTERLEPEGGDAARLPYQLKAWYAPPRATYAKIYGTLTEGGSRKQIIITHYLGENNFDDYNLWRGKHYTYHITVNSLGAIHVDTNVETNNAQLRIDPPADPTSLDAHFGFRMIRIHTEEFTNPEYSVDIEVLKAVNSTDHPEWLDLSLTPITTHQIKSQFTSDEFKLWQQDGGVDYNYVRTKFVPKKSVRSAIAYTPPTGSIGSPEFPDDDTSLPYNLAAHRMCKKISNLPTKAVVRSLSLPLEIMLYADEYLFIDDPLAPAYREAVVRVTLKRNGVDVEYNHFTIRQYPPIRYMKIPNAADNSALLIERVEEYEHMLHPNLSLDRQMLAGLQWGPYKLPNAIDQSKGANNTLYGVYTSGPSFSFRTASSYVSSMYGSEGGSWQYMNNAIIQKATASTPTEGNPYFNLPARTNANYVNTLYNITAARYCHEKNWDVNGNGNIDPEETHWYLPSTLEMQQYWTLRELLNLYPDYYWSSTQASDDDAYAFSMMSSPADADQTYNGVKQALKKTGWHFTNRPRVRCVRRASPEVSGLAPLVRQLANKNLVLDCSNLPGDVYTTESKLDVLQSNYGSVQRANDKLYKKLEIQPTQPAAVNYYQVHSGNGLCDKSKGWRLPTQREMLLIWSVYDKLEAYGTAVFAPFVKTGVGDPGTKYWTMTRGLRAHYIVDFATGLSDYIEFSSTTPQLRYYRCVRELP